MLPRLVGGFRACGGRLGSTDHNLIIARWAAETFAGDQFSEAIVAQGFDAVATFTLQVFVRRQGSGVPYRYGFHYNPNSRSYDLKFDSGTPEVGITGVPGSQSKPATSPGSKLARAHCAGLSLVCP